jgi:hypothetical protein
MEKMNNFIFRVISLRMCLHAVWWRFIDVSERHISISRIEDIRASNRHAEKL